MVDFVSGKKGGRMLELHLMILEHLPRALYPIKKYKGWRYNVFQVMLYVEFSEFPCDRYLSIIFDSNMKVYWMDQIPFHMDSHSAVLSARDAIMKISKSQIPGTGIVLDLGKLIRDKELADHQDFQKKVRRKK